MKSSDLDVERRFHALLEQALTSDTQSREVLLASLEVDEPSLAKELRNCLDEGKSDVMDVFLEGPAVKLASDSQASLRAHLEHLPTRRRRGPAPEDWRVKIKARRSLGLFNLLEVVGTGGVGKVYRAEFHGPEGHEEGSRPRIAALKVLRGVLTEEDAQVQFAQAMTELRELSHPNLATLIDGGVEADGRAYYGSEWVEGPTLMRYCRQHRLSLKHRLGLVLDVCRGLEHAHRLGYFHLGLKPSNILVSTNGGSPLPKITDTGIVSVLPNALTESAVLTRGGLEMALYVSPESIDGELGPVDGQSDVYALGILLFELCAGVLPIEVENFSLMRVVQAILRGETVGLGERWQGLDESTRQGLAAQRRVTVDEMSQVLRGALQDLVRQAMAKAKDDRLPSIGALRRRLEELISTL